MQDHYSPLSHLEKRRHWRFFWRLFAGLALAGICAFARTPDAPEQALCALTAYARLLNGQTALYDMTDLAAGITPAEPDAQEPAEEQEPAAQNGAVVWIVVAVAAAAAGAAVIAASKRRKKE